MENTAAAAGVPKSAEKHALIPHMVITLVSFASNLNIFAKNEPSEPPT